MKRALSLILSLLMCLVALPVCASQSSTPTYADTIAWDASYDVVVIGFGGAGASASVAAAEAGAKVLLTEKAPEGDEGGNTRYSYQIILSYTDYDEGVKYHKAKAEGIDNMTDEIIDFIVKGSMGNADWLESIGVRRPVTAMVAGEYPELPGTESVVFTFVPGKDGKVPKTGSGAKEMWFGLRNAVTERADKIDVWFESPAMHLIQDPFTKTILGVQIERGGEMLNVRALNGVVLACGGFENNEDMIEKYTQREVMHPIGTLYNTGDGVRMGIEVGANQSRMAAMSGPWITIKTDDMPHAWFNQPSMGRLLSKGNAAIYVGKDGTRFTAESGMHRHGHINYSGNFYSQITPSPMYMIFDETAREAGPIMPDFSPDMSKEIESGLIVKADTIAELAEKIGVAADASPANRTQLTDGITKGVDITFRKAGLVNQVERYNQFCKDGYDLQFDRDPETLQAIEKAPFYAIKVEPALVNTQGGPERNVQCEILDTMGKPIPHLYGAGELGSMYGGYYTAGGNLAEAIFSGRTAGANAAVAKDAPAPMPELTAVESQPRTIASDIAPKAEIALNEGEYLGVGDGGMGGQITVKLTMADGKIANVEVVSHNETPGICEPALEQLPAAIVAAGSAEVDVVAGATMTSNAIKDAVNDALSKVG